MGPLGSALVGITGTYRLLQKRLNWIILTLKKVPSRTFSENFVAFNALLFSA